jgi:Uma2 family endonuclease
VVRPDRQHLLKQAYLDGAADLVIEIASDSDPGLDRREKLPRYREAGIEEIWLVDPFEQRVLVETKELRGYVARTLSSGRLESRVLPGFWIDVSWLWRDRLPSALECLRQILGSV